MNTNALRVAASASMFACATAVTLAGTGTYVYVDPLPGLGASVGPLTAPGDIATNSAATSYPGGDGAEAYAWAKAGTLKAKARYVHQGDFGPGFAGSYASFGDTITIATAGDYTFGNALDWHSIVPSEALASVEMTTTISVNGATPITFTDLITHAEPSGSSASPSTPMTFNLLVGDSLFITSYLSVGAQINSSGVARAVTSDASQTGHVYIRNESEPSPGVGYLAASGEAYVVPAPASGAVLAAALVGLATRRRRNCRA